VEAVLIERQKPVKSIGANCKEVKKAGVAGKKRKKAD
jgi:hypothetical protein